MSDYDDGIVLGESVALLTADEPFVLIHQDTKMPAEARDVPFELATDRRLAVLAGVDGDWRLVGDTLVPTSKITLSYTLSVEAVLRLQAVPDVGAKAIELVIPGLVRKGDPPWQDTDSVEQFANVLSSLVEGDLHSFLNRRATDLL